MSNGVREGGCHSREKRKLFQGNDFAYAVARMAVAQICESVEVQSSQTTRKGVRFTSFQNSALDTLTGVAVQYIQSIGKTAQLYANIAGRVEGNSLDIVQALEDLAGVSDTDCCLADSGVVKDIIRYTGEVEEMPFVYALPRFRINKEKRPAPPSFSVVGAEPPSEHIPVWLPAFPQTKLCSLLEEETNVGTIKGENGGRSEVLKHSTQGDEEEMEINPFLTAPLRFLQNEVSPMFQPLELSDEVLSINHVSDKHMRNNHHIPVIEGPAPLDDINKKNKLSESEDGEKKGVQDHNKLCCVSRLRL